MRSRPSARCATRWDCHIFSNRGWGMRRPAYSLRFRFPPPPREARGGRGTDSLCPENLPRITSDCYASRMGKAWARDGDVISGAVLSALGLFIFLRAHQWDYSGPDGPGPGFFPTWYGLGMIAL